MPLYTESSLQMVFDLINTSNPTLPNLLVPASTPVLSGPTSIAVVSPAIQDTSLVLLPRPSSGYVGKATLKYRRRNLATLFRGMTPEVIKYSAASTGQSPFSIYDLLADFNAKFGTSLDETDIVNAAFPSGVGDGKGTGGPSVRSVQINMAAAPSSFGWTGTIAFRWTQGLEDINQVITTSDLGGREYPGGYATGAPAKPQGDFLVYGLNCTAIAANLAAMNGLVWSATATGTQLTNQNTIVAFLRQARPDLNFANIAATSSGGLGGLTASAQTLPSTAYPGANSDKYLNALALPALSTSWFQGTLLMHYNLA